MIPRCDTCVGAKRELCDSGLSQYSELLVEIGGKLVKHAQADELTEAMELQQAWGDVSDSLVRYTEKLECDLPPDAFLERLAQEMQLRTWENPLPTAE